MDVENLYEKQLRLVAESLGQTNEFMEDDGDESKTTTKSPNIVEDKPRYELNHKCRKVMINRTSQPTSNQGSAVSDVITNNKAKIDHVSPPTLVPPLIRPQIDTESQAHASMLMSWYMAGYHTGYHEAMKKFNQTKSED